MRLIGPNAFIEFQKIDIHVARPFSVTSAMRRDWEGFKSIACFASVGLSSSFFNFMG
jgi:hypothetical protein